MTTTMKTTTTPTSAAITSAHFLMEKKAHAPKADASVEEWHSEHYPNKSLLEDKEENEEEADLEQAFTFADRSTVVMGNLNNKGSAASAEQFLPPRRTQPRPEQVFGTKKTKAALQIPTENELSPPQRAQTPDTEASTRQGSASPTSRSRSPTPKQRKASKLQPRRSTSPRKKSASPSRTKTTDPPAHTSQQSADAPETVESSDTLTTTVKPKKAKDSNKQKKQQDNAGKNKVNDSTATRTEQSSKPTTTKPTNKTQKKTNKKKKGASENDPPPTEQPPTEQPPTTQPSTHFFPLHVTASPTRKPLPSPQPSLQPSKSQDTTDAADADAALNGKENFNVPTNVAATEVLSLPVVPLTTPQDVAEHPPSHTLAIKDDTVEQAMPQPAERKSEDTVEQAMPQTAERKSEPKVNKEKTKSKAPKQQQQQHVESVWDDESMTDEEMARETWKAVLASFDQPVMEMSHPYRQATPLPLALPLVYEENVPWSSPSWHWRMLCVVGLALCLILLGIDVALRLTQNPRDCGATP